MAGVQYFTECACFCIFLEPYSEYNVSLNAMTKIGNGTKSDLTARTNQSSMYTAMLKHYCHTIPGDFVFVF
jgi:hypothetical protein